MDRVPTGAIVEPDNNQTASGRRPADDLVGMTIGEVSLDSTGIAERLFDLVYRDSTFGMIRCEVFEVGSIPDDRPIVHPFSIYEWGGQIGVPVGTTS